MSGYSEFRAYSPLFDCDIVRVSMYDRMGGEFYAFIADAGSSRQFREARTTALEMIDLAIRSGLEPGEVRSN